MAKLHARIERLPFQKMANIPVPFICTTYHHNYDHVRYMTYKDISKRQYEQSKNVHK